MLKKYCINLIIVCILSMKLISSYAFQNAKPSSDQAIDHLYHKLNTEPTVLISDRLKHFSSQFLDYPYLLGPLGEGDNARFDQSPLYRTDSFDCLTFVETTLALAFGNNTAQFKKCMRKIRYSEGRIDFICRNHFTDIDWNQNNQKQGYFKDITPLIVNKNHESVFQIASALIDKPSWYQHFTPKRIKLKQSHPDEQIKRLLELKKLGSLLPQIKAETPYIPFSALFDNQGNVDVFLISQIPNAAIIEIVRPNWDLTQQIGTHLNISHLGFVFWINGQLIFRQASSEFNRVTDIPLIDYLNKARSSPTIKGINIQIVVPKHTLPQGC